MSQDKRERRRRCIINAIADRYRVLIDPELLELMLDVSVDPVDAIGEVVGNMRPDEIVVTFHHFGVGR